MASLSGTPPLSVSTIRRLEHGQTVPRVGTVAILALGLGTTIDGWIGS
jgi:transcriptional regulator with XRE-family HTH domain